MDSDGRERAVGAAGDVPSIAASSSAPAEYQAGTTTKDHEEKNLCFITKKWLNGSNGCLQ
jgi:hypothetical protein